MPVRRTELPGAVDNRLVFAQVREDPRLEIAALRGHLRDPIAIVASAGCTALALVAHGADQATGVALGPLSAELTQLDRSMCRRRIVVCDLRPPD